MRYARTSRNPHRARAKLAGVHALMGAGLALAFSFAAAQAPEPELPRPGAVLIASVLGDVVAITVDQKRPLAGDERVRVGTTLETGRKSLATILLSNGASLQLGAESALEVEEFGQATVPNGLKIVELKEEPTVSRTRLRLLRGDVIVEVKPLKVSRGSSFHLSLVAGTVRTGEGTFRARVQMSDLGLGVCTLEVQKGAAEFELPGGNFAPVPVGQKLAFAIEIDRTTGVAKVGEMPKPPAQQKK